MFGSKKNNPPIQTLVGTDTVVRGDVAFRGGFHIDGKVEGDVSCKDGEGSFLSISQTGCVEGSVEVGLVSLNGTVKGDLISREKLELGPLAKVVGDVHYNLLEMTMGAEINGKLVHTAANAEPAKPAKSKAAGEVNEGLGADAT